MKVLLILFKGLYNPWSPYILYQPVQKHIFVRLHFFNTLQATLFIYEYTCQHSDFRNDTTLRLNKRKLTYLMRRALRVDCFICGAVYVLPCRTGF